jgi:hypothetical protein
LTLTKKEENRIQASQMTFLILMREAKLSQKWQNEDARKSYGKMQVVLIYIYISGSGPRRL